MLILLSPSKNLHNKPHPAHRYSLPRLPDQAARLIKAAQKLSVPDLQDLMDINDTLARLTYTRYRSWQWPHTPEMATAAIYTFRGEVYLGFEANTMTKAQAESADKYVRILSGLYGVLRPLDLMQPYRLEMGIGLNVGRSKDLYSFWGDSITEMLTEDIASSKSKEVINLASQEYSAAVNMEKLGVPVVDIQFLEDRNGRLQFLSYNAKRSRGWLARHIVDNNIRKSRDLQSYSDHGYAYRPELSGSNKMVFVR